MKPRLIAACIASLLIQPGALSGQASCRITVEAQVEVARGKVSMADLLSSDTCPALIRAAAEVELGSAPLAGSVRVLAGTEVRARLERLAGNLQNGAAGPHAKPHPMTRLVPVWIVPERISIRRAGARASCADIGARLLASAEMFPWNPGPATVAKSFVDTSAGPAVPILMDCGAAGRIAQQTPLLLTRTVWNQGLGSWEVSARCVHAGDCVPFLVRVPGSGPSPVPTIAPLSSSPQAPPVASPGKPVVHPGEAVTLLWDQDGIRLTVPAVCLDAGATGQRVRARIVSGGRTLPAIVVSPGMLRAAS